MSMDEWAEAWEAYSQQVSYALSCPCGVVGGTLQDADAPPPEVRCACGEIMLARKQESEEPW